MIITNIQLNNFRLYKGFNSLDFPRCSNKNVFLIAGNNGYGKTTLLTSLVWCLYGKLMIDVDDKYRADVHQAGGYKKFAEKLLNRSSIIEAQNLEIGLSKEEFYVRYGTSWLSHWNDLQERINLLSSYSVSVNISDIFIPTLPCNNVTITRSYCVRNQEETLQILIDGLPNELSKEVGPEIFIHDFILPKEIAKFFFFDAEKIVSLAEMTSLEDKKALNIAYTEVLGIKKYQDLKNNLESIQVRFRKQSVSQGDEGKLKELQQEVEQSQKLINLYKKEANDKQEDRAKYLKQANKYQEELIREGSSLSPEMVSDLKNVEKQLKIEHGSIKNKLNELIELAPFAIASKLLAKVYAQAKLESEFINHEVLIKALKGKLNRLKKSIREEILAINIGKEKIEKVVESVHNLLIKRLISSEHDLSDFEILIDLTPENFRELESIIKNLQHSYAPTFKRLVADYKLNRTSYNTVARRLNNAFSKEADPLIKELRKKKDEADQKIEDIDSEILDLRYKTDTLIREISSKSKIIAELHKKVTLEEMDKKKDATAKRLIDQLDVFVTNLKRQKKYSLESKIKEELSILMHKSFIHDVKVIVEDDYIDVELYDSDNGIVQKESLSKGEQQLYATALLKGLVEESAIKFPVFIDSPLQKFDKIHSRNIIGKFYPRISDQVVLFPLLEKELTEQEFEILQPKINKTWIITHRDNKQSEFVEVDSSELFQSFKKSINHVYEH